MATEGNSVPERIARWKVIVAGLLRLLPEMPHLSELHAQLVGIISRSEELDARHEALKAETREVNRIREELAVTGDDLRNRLGAAVRTIHGFKSEKLIEFGLKPRRGRGRDKQPRTSRRPGAPPVSTEPSGATAAGAQSAQSPQ
jgi:hypothetical protein